MIAKRLIELADIYAGYLFVKGMQPDPASCYSVLQFKDIQASGDINFPTTRIFIHPQPKSKYFLKKDDVLFSAKIRLKAIHIRQSFENVVVSSQFFLIRPKSKLINSEYLSWFLNQSPAKKFLTKHTEGTSILGIKLKSLSELPVIILPQDKCNTLLALDQLRQQHQTLTQKLDGKVNQLINKISDKIFSY